MNRPYGSGSPVVVAWLRRWCDSRDASLRVTANGCVRLLCNPDVISQQGSDDERWVSHS